MTAADLVRGVRWYLREFTGEARWDEHLRHCAQNGHAPLTRREFERLRSAVAERHAVDRCC